MDFASFTKSATTENIRAYMGTFDNIHTNPETAKKAGLRGVVAQGGQLAAMLTEFMIRSFGTEFLHGGSISVNFTKLVRPGDDLSPRARVTKISPAAAGLTAVTLDIWLENQHGEVVTAGTAGVETSKPVTS